MSLDMMKAFDTVSHEFMDAVLQFFGFGNKFRETIKLLGCNRTAGILDDSGKCGKVFSLERGRPQGDTISPVTFNFAMQILIFKLELNKDIRGVELPPLVPVPVPVPVAIEDHEHFLESGFENGKMECFADDANIITDTDVNSIKTVKTSLEKFGEISGLVCNIEKTAVMLI